MAVLDRITGNGATADQPGKPPKDVQARLKRGNKQRTERAAFRRVAFRFFRGDQYCWVNEKRQVSFLPTVTHTTGGGKEPHRVRTSRNYIRGIVENKISQATTATPGYDVAPTTTDPEAASAAKTSQKVAFYGYDKWNFRKARVKAVTNALVADGGYALPFFDPDVGPYVRQPDGSFVGYGEIKVRVFNGSQVAWEPGMDFEDSPWHAVITAQSVGSVKEQTWYTGGDLRADANTSDVPTDRPTDEMVMVTEYFERPSRQNPQGRKLMIANDRQIAQPEDFPLVDASGNVCDEPALHQLVYTVDPDSDRDMGLVEALIDPQRTLNDAISKIVEWKNRCLNPRILAPRGSLKRPPDDAPGMIDWYDPVGQFKPEWQQTPPIPRELFSIVDQAIQQMQAIAADPAVTADTNAAPGTVQAIAAQAQARWTTFLTDLAEFDSRLMRHSLYLVARYYAEPRLLELKGRWDWDNIPDFRGSMMRGQCQVRVLADSLQARSKDQVKADIQFWQTNYPGAIPVEAAMAAYYGGLADNMMQDFRLDIQRANEIIQAIRGGPGVLFSRPMQPREQVDPSGQVQMTEVPWWMPRETDNVRVWKHMIATWTKTTEFDQLDAGMQQATFQIYDQLLKLEADQAARQQAMQTQMAQQLGAANAAAPQGQALPSLPAASGAPPVANQAGGTGVSQQ